MTVTETSTPAQDAPVGAGPGAALDAVRRVLREDADAVARGLLDAARREAAQTVDEARAQAADLLAAARADGEAQGRAAARADRAAARRRARERVLAARRSAFDEATDRAAAQARALRDGPDHPRIVAGLAALARAQLGPDAVVATDDAEGGVTARLGDRSVDYRLPEVARRCAEAMVADLEALWR